MGLLIALQRRSVRDSNGRATLILKLGGSSVCVCLKVCEELKRQLQDTDLLSQRKKKWIKNFRTEIAICVGANSEGFRSGKGIGACALLLSGLLKMLPWVLRWPQMGNSKLSSATHFAVSLEFGLAIGVTFPELKLDPKDGNVVARAESPAEAEDSSWLEGIWNLSTMACFFCRMVGQGLCWRGGDLCFHCYFGVGVKLCVCPHRQVMYGSSPCEPAPITLQAWQTSTCAPRNESDCWKMAKQNYRNDVHGKCGLCGPL